MNPEYFGLNRPPFRTLRAYPGPQQLALAGSVKRCLIAPDSVLTVTGPVGTGKTVSVRHALDRLDSDKLVARIGRTHLDRHEVLEQLLDDFGVDPIPASSLKRLAALHRVFGVANLGRHVFILVEDAERLGADVIAELESLTAADDESAGAHLILLGPPTLEEFLKDPLLVRLNQRIRRRTELAPFSAGETRGYIEHCLRRAGGTPDEIIDDDAIAIIHDCSSGVARLVNAIAEAMLFAASEENAARIDRRLALRVARDEFGYITGDEQDDEMTDLVQDQKLPSAAASTVVTTGAGELTASPAVTATAVGDAELRSVRAAADSDAPSAVPTDDIEDTRPELATLSGFFSAPDASPTDAALRALRNATPPASRTDTVTNSEDSAARSNVLEPAHPRPLSKSSDPSDTQTIRALDDALRPDTQWFASLDDVPNTSDVPDSSIELPPATSPEAETEARDETASRPATKAAVDASMTDSLPTLSEDRLPEITSSTAAVEDGDSAAEARSVEVDPSMTGTVPALSEKLMSELASSSNSSDAADRSARETSCDTSMTGTVPALSEELMSDIASTLASAGNRDAEVGASARATAVESGPENESSPAEGAPGTFEPSVDMSVDDDSADLPTLSLQETASSPALDTAEGPSAADTHPASSDTQETARPPAASATEPAPAGTDEETELKSEAPELSLVPEITLDNALQKHQQEAQAKVREEAAKIAGAAEGASGTAEETPDDGEQQKRRLQTLAARFSQARSLEDVMDDTAAETLFGEEFSQIAAAVTSLHEALGDVPAGDASPAAANSDAFSPTGSAQATPPEPMPRTPPAVTEPAVPADTKDTASAEQAPTKPDLDSSAARRLEMVRALNRKAGKKLPPMPPPLHGGPEEIVLGVDNDNASGAKPEPIENQFGPSMTNTLRALSAENIRRMQEAEEAEKAAKKGGLLSRFRRS